MLKLSDLPTLNALQYRPQSVASAPTTGASNATGQNVTSYSGFGELNPLVSDLVKTTAAPNRFSRATYSYDPTAVQNRLNEYSVVDQGKYNAYKPILGDLAPTQSGSNYYFKSADLNNALGQYSVLDKVKYDTYKPLISNLSPATQVDGNYLYKTADLNSELGKYSALDQATYDKYAGLKNFSALNPLVADAGNRYYDTAKLNEALGGYTEVDPTKVDIANEWLKNQFNSRLETANGKSYLTKSNIDYLNNPFADTQFVNTGDTKTVPAGYVKDTSYNNAWRDKYYDPVSGQAIYPFRWNANDAGQYYSTVGNTAMGANQAAPLWSLLDMGYKKNANGGIDTAESAFFLPNLFNPVNGGSDQYYFKAGQTPTAEALNKYGVASNQNGMQGWIMPDWASYENMMRASGLDPYQNLSVTHTWQDKGGGGILGSIGNALSAVAPILAFTPLAPIAAGFTLGQGLGSGNLGQIAAGALGTFAPGLGGDIGKALGASGNAASALGGGILGAGMGLIGGQSLGDALKSGTIGGLAAYGGSLLGDKVGGGLTGKVVGNLGASALSAAMRGGNMSQALQNSLMNTSKGALGALVGKQLNFDKLKI